MKREDIEKQLEIIQEAHWDSVMAKHKAFTASAEWRINSVYHKASEEPESGKMVLAIREGYNPFICGPYHYDWETTVENFNIIKWAYVKDLIPETED